MLSVLHLAMLVAAAGTPAPAPAPSFQRIDTHSHYVPPFYKDLLDSRGITVGGIVPPVWNASNALAVNAEFGIVKSVLSVSTPGAKLSPNDSVEEGRTLARQLNEFGYNLTKEYPDNYLFFATLTLPDLDGAIAEAIYALDTLGAAGVFIEASFFGEVVGTSRYDPLYKLLNDRCAIVFLHPSETPCSELPDETTASESIPTFVVDFLLDTTRAAINLVYRNVTVDYPNIKYIIAHSGGFLPFAATRASGGLTLITGEYREAAVYFEELQKFHVDLATSATLTALPSTLAFFNTSQVTYGTDLPFASALGVEQNDLSFAAYPLDPATREKFDYSNAYGLFEKFWNKAD